MNGFVRNYSAVTWGNALLLLGIYLLAALIIGGLARIYFRDWNKAALLCFWVLAFEFFFGNVQSLLKNNLGVPFFGQYRFLVPVGLFFFTGLLIWLKRRTKPFGRVVYFLNTLFLLLIAVETVRLAGKRFSREPEYIPAEKATDLRPCTGCNTPDIYFILLDQYTGKEALLKEFGFDNSGFEKALTDRGFHVFSESNSNYNLTPFSMASILNMNYLGTGMGRINHLDVTYSYSAVRRSLVPGYLQQQGYTFYNYSLFDFPSNPSAQHSDFFPYGTDLITWETLSARLYRDIRADVHSGKIRLRKWQEQLLYKQLRMNNELFRQTAALAEQRTDAPKFVYAHFLLPHWPYYFDSRGNPVPEAKLEKSRETNAADYIGYLQYANHRVLGLVDSLTTRSAAPPVIILLSDHGYRHPEKQTDQRSDFNILAAVLLPDRDYTGLPSQVNGVNFFRVFLNHSFRQQLPLLKDSLINILD